MWNDTKDGQYSVRSGYWLAKSMKDAMSLKPSSSAINSSLWNWIWQLNTLSKIKLFVWRCMKGILPTRMNLRRRGMDGEFACPCCGLEEETAEHALRDCGWSNFYWKACLLRLDNLSLMANIPIQDWIMLIVNGRDSEYINLFISHLWMLWRARNMLVFEKKIIDHQECFKVATSIQHEYWSTNELKRLTPNQSVASDKWTPPPSGYVKLNTDASIRSDSTAGLGGIFRDENGKELVAFAFRKDDCSDVLIAEALACLEGVRIAQEFQFQNIIIETDCLGLVQGLRHAIQPPSYFGNILTKIVMLLRNFTNVRVEWIRRSANSLAHNLARFAFDTSCTNYFLGLVPERFRHIVIVEADL